MNPFTYICTHPHPIHWLTRSSTYPLPLIHVFIYPFTHPPTHLLIQQMFLGMHTYIYAHVYLYTYMYICKCIKHMLIYSMPDTQSITHLLSSFPPWVSCYTVQAALNLWFSFFRQLRAGITDICHHAQLWHHTYWTYWFFWFTYVFETRPHSLCSRAGLELAILLCQSVSARLQVCFTVLHCAWWSWLFFPSWWLDCGTCLCCSFFASQF